MLGCRDGSVLGLLTFLAEGLFGSQHLCWEAYNCL